MTGKGTAPRPKPHIATGALESSVLPLAGAVQIHTKPCTFSSGKDRIMSHQYNQGITHLWNRNCRQLRHHMLSLCDFAHWVLKKFPLFSAEWSLQANAWKLFMCPCVAGRFLMAETATPNRAMSSLKSPPWAQHPRVPQYPSHRARRSPRHEQSTPKCKLPLHRTGQQPLGGTTLGTGPSRCPSTHGARLSSVGSRACVHTAAFALHLLWGTWQERNFRTNHGAMLPRSSFHYLGSALSVWQLHVLSERPGFWAELHLVTSKGLTPVLCTIALTRDHRWHTHNCWHCEKSPGGVQNCSQKSQPFLPSSEQPFPSVINRNMQSTEMGPEYLFGSDFYC